MKKNVFFQTLRTVAAIVLLICLTVILFVGTFYFSLGGFLTDADAYISIADKAQKKNGFYSDMYRNACERLVSRGTLGGFPAEMFEGLLGYDYTVTAFADYVRFTVNEHEGKFRLTEFDDSLRAACVAYANSEEARSSGFSATEAEIEEFVDYIDGQVVAVIALPFFSGVYPTVRYVYEIRVVAVAVGGFAVAVGLIFGILCLLERGKAVNAVRQCLYSLSGAGIMTLVIGVLLDVLNGNEFFSFSSQAVLDYLNIFKDSLSLRVNAVGIAVATVGISALACITVFSGRGKRCESKEAEFRNIGENKNENINTENN